MVSVDERGPVMKGIRYEVVDEVPTQPWVIQGTVYADIKEAKYAAMKVYASCNNNGVIVKHVVGGWAPMFWRKAK